MFETEIQGSVPEISHKLVERPIQNAYFSHSHDHCEILLFIQGSANYNIDGQIFFPAPYDLLLIPSGTYHHLCITEMNPYENYIIGINTSIIDVNHLNRIFSAPFIVNIKKHQELCNFFPRLDSYYKNFNEKDFSVCALALIQELCTCISYCKHELNIVHSSSMIHIHDIIQFISENIELPLNAEMIARHFLISKSHLQNIFSQNMHIGLKKYITLKKLHAANTDIKQGLPPSRACEKYNFGDYSNFYRQYKLYFSKSPKQ